MRRRPYLLLALAVAGCGGSATTAARGDRDCTDFADQAASQAWLDNHPGDPDALDGDGNGVACERD